MCVILYVPPKKRLKPKYLETAFNSNPDGAGVMTYDWQGNVVFKKGFMKYQDLKKYWEGMDDRLPRAIHCRIATSGEVNEKNCHPFQISEAIEEMQVTEGIATNGLLMHNGILRDYAPRDGLKCNYSDTMAFNKMVVAPIAKAGALDNAGVSKLINGLDNVFLIFLPQYKVLQFGDWITDGAGFYASNSSYKEDKWLKYVSKDWSRYGYCEGFSYKDVAVDTVVPRYEYTIEYSVEDGDEDPVVQLDDFLYDMADFIVDDTQPYETYDEADGIIRFIVSAYSAGDFERFIPKGYTIINKKVIDKEMV